MWPVKTYGRKTSDDLRSNLERVVNKVYRMRGIGRAPTPVDDLRTSQRCEVENIPRHYREEYAEWGDLWPVCSARGHPI
jgi:hypothetical protein